MTPPLPRGIRNHNPLNIRSLAVNGWHGEVPAARRTDSEFEQFEDPVFGLRAAIKLIRIHHRRGSDTIRKLAIVWAPPGENPHLNGYMRTVAKQARLCTDEVFDAADNAVLKRILKGMIRAENGMQPYSDQTLDTALALAADPSQRKQTA